MQKNIPNKVRKPTAIKILSALCIIAGLILIVILGIEKYVMPSTSLTLLNAITIAIISVVSILLGYGILSGDGKSLILIGILIIILIVVQLIQIATGELSGIYGLIVGALVLYSLTRKDVRRMFGFKIY